MDNNLRRAWRNEYCFVILFLVTFMLSLPNIIKYVKLLWLGLNSMTLYHNKIYIVALFLKYFAYIGLFLWLYCDSPKEEAHVLHQLSILCNTSCWRASTYRKLIDLGIQELQHPSYGKLKHYQSPGTNYIISQNLDHNLL